MDDAHTEPGAPLPPPLPTTTTNAPVDPADVALLNDVLARGESTAGARRGESFVISAVLFLGLGAALWGWQTVVFIAIAVALHELGHVFAMRLFGYRNVRMLFVPLFGGLASGEPRELDGTRNAQVALAGPAFGLLTTAVAGVLAPISPHPELLLGYAWLSLLINAFNLLPIYPLDGGQVANETVFSRVPVLESIFRLLAIAALAWIAFELEAWLLAILPLWLLLSLSVSYRRAVIVREARWDPRWVHEPLGPTGVRMLREMTAKIFRGVPPEKYQAQLAGHVHGLWLEIRKRQPGAGATVGLLLFYGACVMGAFFSWALYAWASSRFGA